MYVLCFYVPEEDKGRVKDAIFASGAGKIGAYDRCCFEVSGHGQFRPLAGANPTIGQINTLEIVSEVKIEVVVEDDRITEVLRTMIAAHPYEQPAYHVFKSFGIPLLRAFLIFLFLS